MQLKTKLFFSIQTIYHIKFTKFNLIELKISEICSQLPCKNNGKCNKDPSSVKFYNCSCQASYFGENCEKRMCKLKKKNAK